MHQLGHDLALSMPQLGHDLEAINASTRTRSRKLLIPKIGHDLQLIHLEQGQDYSLALIKAESLYQLSIFLHVRLELGFNDLITSYPLL